MRLSKRLSTIQAELLNDLRPGTWYDVFVGQGTGGEILPDWFLRNQSAEMQTIRPLVAHGKIEIRYVDKLPQVRKI